MNKKLSFRFLIITLAATLTISFILPFNYISADTNNDTHYFTATDYILSAYTNKPSSGNRYLYVKANDEDTRFVNLVYKRNSSYAYELVTCAVKIGSYPSIHYRIDYKGSNGNVTTGSTDTYDYQSTYTVNGVTYYMRITGDINPNPSAVGETYYVSDYGYYLFSNAQDRLTNSVKQVAYDYTFGDSAQSPEPPLQAGTLTYNYYTDFSSNSQTTINAMKSNKDTITWDYDFTNSNISALDLKVDIRAIPVNYYSATEEDLKSLSWNSLNLNASLYADLGSYHINYNMRKVSYTWEEVVDKIKYISNLPDIYNNLVNDWNFKIFNLDNYYYWTGWVYQIRLNTESGDYVGEWQTIYQVSSAPPDSATTTINYYVNGTGMTEPIYQTIQNINNQNNVTNNTWYVNGSPYDIDDSSGQSWWEQLLQFITNIVSEILGFLGSIFDSVITGVLEFIHDLGIDFLGLFENLISNIVDLFGNIDLTGNDYTIPEEYTDDLNTYNTWTTGVFNIFFSSGLALFVLIPLLLMIVRLVL